MNELDRCPRCDEPYETLQEGDQLKGKCNGCGLSAIVTSVAALISPYTPEDVLHYEMTKKVVIENAD
jgi:hypothetical protein